jgi:dihydrofolate reductase
MKLIVAINNLGYIGKEDKMLWQCKDDLKHFKHMTLGKKLLVGRKTFENLPPLKDREMLVVGTGYLTLEEALDKDPDWVIGGASIYRQTHHLCEEFHISKINNNDVGDIKFPDIEMDGQIFYYNFC